MTNIIYYVVIVLFLSFFWILYPLSTSYLCTSKIHFYDYLNSLDISSMNSKRIFSLFVLICSFFFKLPFPSLFLYSFSTLYFCWEGFLRIADSVSEQQLDPLDNTRWERKREKEIERERESERENYEEVER